MAEAAKEEDEVVQNVQDINLPARVNNLVIGDLNLQVRGNLNEENGATVLGAPNASLEERVKEKDDFLKIQVQSSDINLKILEGDKSILFNHRLLQEFFAALQLMFDTPLEGFTNHQTKFESVQFEMVLQFLFGLLNPELHGKLKALFPISLADISDKKRFLEDLLVSMAEKFTKTSVEDFPLSLDGVFDVVFYEKWEKFLARPVDNSLFKLCSLAYESMDPELTKTLVKVFPNMVLLSRTILPSHVASLCHVLRATDNPIAITIGSFVEQANFIGDGLKMLIETVSQTPHTIRKFHIAYAPMEIATLAPLIPQMEALTLWQCDLSCQDIKLISESLQKKTCPIELLDLSLNHMDEAGVELLCLCLPKIRRLRLVQCRITSDHFLLLANRIEQLQHPMAVLDLNGNTIGSDCARCWAILAHKVDVLGLRNCGIYEIGVFTDAIARRNYPMEAIDISQNPLGDRGASALARCRKNIERLVRSNCNFTAAGVETLESAELRLLQNQAGRDHRTLISVLWTALQNAFQ